MEESSDNLKDPYYEIYTINNYFLEDNGKLKVNPKCKSIHNYCYYSNTPGKDKCNNYLEMTNCSVIYLLKTLKEKYKLEDDKIAEYAILWLNYNLNIKPNNNFTNLNEFYTKYIVNNECYNKNINGDDGLTYKNIIDANNDLTNMNINEISKFNRPFSILFYLYHAYYHYYWDCDRNLGYANSFVSEFKNLNDDPNNIENSSYNKLLSTLSNDYNNLKNIFYDKNASCKFPSLPKIEPKENSVGNSGKGSGQIMGQSSYSIEEVYKEIKKVDDCLPTGIISTGVSCSNDSVLNEYCPIKREGGNRQCDTNNDKISAGFIWLLISFENLCDSQCSDDENEKYAEYGILWLGYRLNQILDEEITTLKDFYTKYIKDNKDDVDYKDRLDDKINSMDINIKDISNIYEAFGILCEMYTAHNENDKECTNCSQYADEFVQKIEELNKDPSIARNDSYSKILSTLSNDYNYLKNHYATNCSGCSNIPNFPEIKTPHFSVETSTPSHVQDNPDSSLQGSEVTSSSSSVASKLIPVLSIFAISLFLGIAYKYSLFGFGKRVHRKHLREKLKK
ncbi:CIR protein [Plasmodium chabaudi chabaudi]|uniref:CIR protein n=1 Tax=Plasmodium chabaudi chabaudi TaxID=31271 RepID=A0A4V0KE26_PLACU|nr:CIR protein [Plasmodium chabaudi chabaudi]VTZ70668.1 CIR protein [Plasmodium chabaudi chabaudi]|eukprot:XP_016652941.1 CIR protein [Plasmodium chabaudi chabaudi]